MSPGLNGAGIFALTNGSGDIEVDAIHVAGGTHAIQGIAKAA